MKSIELKFDQENMDDGLAPGWRWRVLINGKAAAEGTHVYFPEAMQAARWAVTQALCDFVR